MVKILMLVNWKVRYCDQVPSDLQPPDYYVADKPYWFFRYFNNQCDVDVVDISSLPAIESIEKEGLRFYIIQTLRVIPRLNKYDCIISHGVQSGILLSLWRRLFKTKSKHIVFDIGSFASASEKGPALKLMQYASKSIDGLIYHTSSQLDYYSKFFPWLVERSTFIPFGADLDFFQPDGTEPHREASPYFTCIGAGKRDWDTLIDAYQQIDTDVRLKVIGHVDDRYKDISGVDMVPHVPVNVMKSYIAGASFCVLPLEVFNYSYGQMTFMQQMAMGKCVIAARVPSLLDYAIDGESALFYEPKDVTSLMKCIQTVIRDESLRDRIAAHAPQWLADNRSESNMANKVEDFIQLVIDNNVG